MDCCMLTLEQVIDLNLVDIPKGMIDDGNVLDPEYVTWRVDEAPLPLIQWSHKEFTSILERFQPILANTHTWLKGNGVRLIKIKVGKEDDSMGPLGRKYEIQIDNKEGASSSGMRIKLRVSWAMVLPPEEAPVCGKEKSHIHIHVIDPDDPGEGQQSDDAPKSLDLESPHEIPSLFSMELPLSPPNTIVDDSPQNGIPLLAIEPPLDHQQESLLEIFEDTPACIHLSEIDTSTSIFDEFMK